MERRNVPPADDSIPARPLTVGMLGCGVVGQAVVASLRRSQERFRLARVAVRRPWLDRNVELDPAIVTSDANEVVDDPDIDVVVEAISGADPATSYILRALRNGKDVVSANKAAIAAHGCELEAAASDENRLLRYEAAVCGAVPIVRALRTSVDRSDIVSMHGILNGTTNYILDTMASEGTTFAGALEAARERGYAEANASDDISGYDSARKAVILGRLAFGEGVQIEVGEVRGIEAVSADEVARAITTGHELRLVATIERGQASEVTVDVRPVSLPARDALARTFGARNRIVVRCLSAGALVFEGEGAGGPATAAAITSDLSEIWDLHVRTLQLDGAGTRGGRP